MVLVVLVVVDVRGTHPERSPLGRSGTEHGVAVE